jgi:hypothetical protein
MFGEKTMEATAITGTGAYQVNTGTSGVGSFNAWRSQIGNGKTAFYYAQRGDGTIWEAGWGTLTFGSPDLLSRTLIASSTGALISWVVGDAPIYLFSAPSATFLAGILSGYVARPAWAPANFRWADITAGVATRIIDKIFNGTADVETGRYEGVPGVYVPSPRRPYLAKGAASYVVTANDIGWRFSFDTSAAARAMTLPAGSSVGMGFVVEAIGLSAINPVNLTPNGTDVIDFGAAGALLAVPGRIPFSVRWDGDQWRSSYVAAATGPVYAGVRQTVASGPIDTNGFPTSLPATAASLTLSEQNISASYPQVLSAANGWNAATGQAVDVVGFSSTAQSWNLAANSTLYLYKTIAANGTMTASQTTLAPIYQWGGTPSTVNGQFTFNISEMRGYMGNGSTAPQANIVIVGECVTGASTVSSAVAYAYNGKYDSGFTATLPAAATAVSKNHNIGVQPRTCDFVIENTTTEGGYAVGSQITASSGLQTEDGGSTLRSPVLTRTPKTIAILPGAGTPAWLTLNQSSGAGFAITNANWKYKFVADRGW